MRPRTALSKSVTPARVGTPSLNVMVVPSLLLFLTLGGLTGCVAFRPWLTEDTPATDTSSSTAPQGTSALTPQSEPPATQRDVASLQSKVDGLERTVMTLRGDLAALKRGARSGLFDDVPQTPQSPKTQEDGVAFATPDLGFEDAFSARTPHSGTHATPNSLPESPDLKTSTPPAGPPLDTLKKIEAPGGLIEQALQSIQSKDYGAAIVTLTTLRERFPGFQDEGLSDVLLAESWNALSSPDKALIPLERFFSVHSTSPLLPRAKLAQAGATRALGQEQKSIQLLLEVIALAPETKTADVARSRLAEMREVR